MAFFSLHNCLIAVVHPALSPAAGLVDCKCIGSFKSLGRCLGSSDCYCAAAQSKHCGKNRKNLFHMFKVLS